MSAVLLFACLPHVIDVKKFGAFERQDPLVLNADGSSQPEVASREYLARKSGLRFTFKMKIKDGRAELGFLLEEGDRYGWHIKGDSRVAAAVSIGRHPLVPIETEIVMPVDSIPSLKLTCALEEKPGDFTVDDVVDAKTVPAADAAATTKKARSTGPSHETIR